ncbi:MAG: AbrB/MazE/SpoVT family DNA-binding domain-containing protein [Candidatus Hermodarchaeota archaeon]
MELKLLGSSKISKGKQITLPKEVRDILKVDSGDIIGFYLDKEGRVVIQ